MIEKIQRVEAMLQDGFNWDQHYASGGDPVEAYIRDLIMPSVRSGDLKYIECGSYAPTNTPAGLYRLLWLAEPKEVDFSDMYKNRLFSLMSTDERFVISVEMFKCELGLYFYAPKEMVNASGFRGVIAGWPGANNGLQCTDETGIAFFDLVKKIVEHEFEVYSGNHFRV
jgi:hypothetical protein